jgi:hypothetical protein
LLGGRMLASHVQGPGFDFPQNCKK